jgi:hypothetical protein
VSLAPRKRRVRRPPDLTSLFDVLFIVVFVALIRAAAAEHVVAEAAKEKEKEPVVPAPAPPPLPLEVSALKQRAVRNVAAELEGRQPLVIRINEKGVITRIEGGDKQLTLDVPLLVPDPDPTIRVAYQGDRSAQLRACRVAMLQLGLADLGKHLVIFAPARARDDLPHALVSGLERDLTRCLSDQNAIATLVEPIEKPTP